MTKLQIDKAVSKILYSVIETGVCRIITCQQPKILNQVKSVYQENLPQDHSLLWLPGNINSIEQLSLILRKAGILSIKPSSEYNELIEQIRAYLVRCQQQGRLEIWVFESAELLSSEICKLLGELVNSDYSDKALFSFELWGNAQLDVHYHSGQLQACCCTQHYYIPVGKQILLAAKPKLPHRALTTGLAIFVLGTLLGSGYLYRSNINIFDNTVELAAADIAASVVDTMSEQTSEPTSELTTELTPELAAENVNKSFVEPVYDVVVNKIPEQALEQTLEPVAYDTAGTAFDVLESGNENATETVQEQALKFSVENTPNITALGAEPEETLGSDSVNNKHWFYSLSYSQWREKHQISLRDDIDRQDGLYYLQLGVYKQQESLSKFFELYVLPTQTYYFCYSEKDNIISLVTGTYNSASQAYDAHRELLTQGLESSVVAVAKYAQWQCSIS